ncbi:MAG: MBOAT family O-acyltransferase [Acidobacteriaceae bacterium]
MLFSSGVFLFLFLPVALLGYEVSTRFGRRTALAWLSLSSLFFYGYWSPRYLILLVASVVMNFLFSLKLVEGRSEKSRSLWLKLAILANLLLLMYYKYLFPVLGFLHVHGMIEHGFGTVILPLGISFFTFTQIAYQIDLRQGIAKQQGLLAYSVFATFFPHLIAGPIIHPRELMPQLDPENIRSLDAEDMLLGSTWFVMGLAKKVLIADRISPLADLLFAHPWNAGMGMTWLGALAYAMQLYFDFSGYSDMALGLARMFHLRFPINFNSPFKAQGIIEFWTRWHMTLSRYLNEYLYTPFLLWIRGRRSAKGLKSNMKAAGTPSGFIDMVFLPSMYTMGIAGIWHGAGLQFLVFGLLHGVYLTINHGWRFLTPPGSRFHRVVPVPVMVAINFLAVLLGLIFFRAASVHDAVHIATTMCGIHGLGPGFYANPWLGELSGTAVFLTSIKGAVVALAFCAFIVWGLPNTQEMLGQAPAHQEQTFSLGFSRSWRPLQIPGLWVGIFAVVTYFILFLGERPKTFLYFQF